MGKNWVRYGDKINPYFREVDYGGKKGVNKCIKIKGKNVQKWDEMSVNKRGEI